MERQNGRTQLRSNESFHLGYIALAFLIPMLLTLLSFLALRITPFGSKMLTISDANGYYMPYLSYCKSIFHGQHGLFYSFSQSIGGGIAATIWPYLLNPFSWIFSLFEYEGYPTAYTYGVILITGFYGLNMYLLLADIHGHKIENLLISTCYAMSGFAVCFNINTAFFMGGPLCLPLMLLGLRKLFRGESPALYIVSLAYPIILQIQMGFAVCMAALLLFLAKLYVENHRGEQIKLWSRFIAASVSGGLLGAIVWLPEILIIRQGRGALSIDDFTFTANAPLLQNAARFFTGANSASQIASGFPAIFCGILPLALVVLYFRNNHVNNRRKAAYAALLVVYILGFFIRTFSTVYQGFTHANWFNYRFSFVFTFILLLIAAEQLNRLEEVSEQEAKRCGSVVFGVTVLVFFLEYGFVDGAMALLDLALLGIMGAAFLFHKRAPERAPQRVLALFLCFCTIFQLYLNTYFCNRRVLRDWEDLGTHYAEYILQEEPMIRAIQTVDDGFYRIESEHHLDGSIGNDSLFLDYNGVGFAGHTERGFVHSSLGKLGISFWSRNWNFYDDGIPAATDALLGIKYVMSERDLAKEKGYTYKAHMDNLVLYESPYALPIGFVSADDIRTVELKDGKNIFANLNAVWRGLTGETGNIFTEEQEITYSNHNPSDIHSVTHEEVMQLMESESADAESVGAPTETGRSEEESSAEDVPQRESWTDDNRFRPYIEFRFTAKQNGPVYIYDSSAYFEDIGSSEDIVQYVGTFDEGEEVVGKLYLNYEISEQLMIDTVKGLHICYADNALLREYCEKLRAGSCTIVKETDSRLSGDVELSAEQRLFFTIPYDEGWTLMVDGAEVPLEKTADLFMSANIGEGGHHYTLSFLPSGLKVGIAASCFAFLLMVLLCIIMHRDPGKYHPTDGSEEIPERDDDGESRKALENESNGKPNDSGSLMAKPIPFEWLGRTLIPEWIAFAGFIALYLIISHFHEPWYDEAMAWQVAKYASIKDILLTVTHSEGHPPLWHLILAIPAKLGVPYEIGLKGIGLLFSALSVWVLLFKSHLPKAVKVFVPFTYFFFYQSGIIVRPYTMMILAVLLLAVNIREWNQKPWKVFLALVFLCLTHAVGMIIACGISICFLLDLLKEKGFSRLLRELFSDKRTRSLLILFVIAVILAIEIFPTEGAQGLVSDTNGLHHSFMTRIVFALFALPAEVFFLSGGWFQYLTRSINELHITMPELTVFVIIGVLIWTIVNLCSSKRGFKYFAIPYLLFAVFSAVVYFARHHVSVVMMIFLLWAEITCQDEGRLEIGRAVTKRLNLKTRGLRIALACAVACSLIIPMYWCASASVTDIAVMYDPGRGNAAFLKAYGLENYSVFTRYNYTEDRDGTECIDINNVGLPVSTLAYLEGNPIINVNCGDDSLPYSKHEKPSAEESAKTVEQWREMGIPDVLLFHPELEETYGDKISYDDYTAVADFPYAYIWKAFMPTPIYSVIHVRNELAEELGLETPYELQGIEW